ncbi:aldehyde dehydrogenase family protein [Streptomyces sp900105755]|uniref:Aldehyde dehydrogenase family protein n=1 Tax=Streptomyces sp. 900105755 TaxID=3154389 RepID=A0ABV1TN18_9ACTN
MIGPSTDVVPLDALGARGSYRSRSRLTVTDVAGQESAELSLVPSLFVDRTLKAMHLAATPARDVRIGMIAQAAELFATATLDGLTPDAYAHRVSRVGGTPISVVRATVTAIASRLRKVHHSVEHARPTGAVHRWDDPLTRTGRAVWVRRGNVFAVHAAGNHPGPHSLWPEALALGYRVAVRPSRREPYTPHRLVTALRAAGFGDDQVALLPTDHAAAGALLRGADVGLVYGGDDVVRKYAGNPSVLPQGPGRSKILLTHEVDWRDHLDTIVDSVSGHGGTGCVNTTAVFVEGDPAPLCAALAERLAAVPSLPPQDPAAVFPVQPLATAKALEAHLLHRAVGTKPWLGGDGILAELGDGSAVLRGAVHQLDSPHAPQATVEMPFPCVWVAPWTREDGLAPLKGSLVLTAITHDEGLVAALVEEPSIGNVYVGDHRTYWMDSGLPHDGYLAEFLMRCKSVIRD